MMKIFKITEFTKKEDLPNIRINYIENLSYTYKAIKFGGNTEAEIIAANGPEYALEFKGKHLTLEQAETILRFFDLMNDIC